MATNPYTAPSISGYNSSPPPDAGETTAANTVEWDKHKTKLGDPIKTLSETDITNTTTAFSKVINIDDNENNAMGGSLAFKESTLTISSGSVTATRRNHLIAAQTGTTDDLANITTGSVSDFAEMIIRPDSGDTITVKDAATGAGEIHLIDNLDFIMSGDESLTLQRRGADWYEISRGEEPVNVLVQMVKTQTGAVSTGTTITPSDDTIPSITEGDEFMTLAITPLNTTNRLIIEVNAQAASGDSDNITTALHQDTTTDALAAVQQHVQSADAVFTHNLLHEMQAGTTSSTTFRVRIGASDAGTVTFNGANAGRLLGGIIASSIVIREYTA